MSSHVTSAPCDEEEINTERERDERGEEGGGGRKGETRRERERDEEESAAKDFPTLQNIFTHSLPKERKERRPL